MLTKLKNYTWIPNKYLEFNTKNFLLRTLTVDDATKNHVSWLNNKKINKWLNSYWKKHTLETVKHFIMSQDHYNVFHLAIIDKKEKYHIGNFTIIVDHYHKTAETRVLIGEEKWWGKGVVIECRENIINWLFNELRMHKIYGQPALKNIAAIFNYQQQGYKCEAILKDHKLFSDNNRYDVGIFSLSINRWIKIKK